MTDGDIEAMRALAKAAKQERETDPDGFATLEAHQQQQGRQDFDPWEGPSETPDEATMQPSDTQMAESNEVLGLQFGNLEDDFDPFEPVPSKGYNLSDLPDVPRVQRRAPEPEPEPEPYDPYAESDIWPEADPVPEVEPEAEAAPEAAAETKEEYMERLRNRYGNAFKEREVGREKLLSAYQERVRDYQTPSRMLDKLLHRPLRDDVDRLTAEAQERQTMADLEAAFAADDMNPGLRLADMPTVQPSVGRAKGLGEQPLDSDVSIDSSKLTLAAHSQQADADDRLQQEADDDDAIIRQADPSRRA